MSRRARSLGALFASLLVCMVAGARVDTDEPWPRLAVVVVVDGLSPRQLDRVQDLFVGGFRRLQAEGAVLENCHHDHAETRTGPGHFTLLSGRYPGPAGILSNGWFDPIEDRRVSCIEDGQARIAGTDRRAGSYQGVAASSLGDRLRQRWPGSRVFSFAGKERSAIMMAGRTADGAYWFDDETGRFVTSTYYQDEPHAWVENFNAAHRADDFRHAVWERFLADTLIYEQRARRDSFPGERDLSPGDGRPAPIFDHTLDIGVSDPDPTPEEASRRFYRRFEGTPFADEIVIEIARAAILAEELGRDAVPDLLCIGLSAHDHVAHDTGPFSQESIDVVLRLDRLLGELIEFLDVEVGDGHYVFCLTSDHGFMPLPEYVAVSGLSGARVGDAARRFTARIDSLGTAMAGGRKVFRSAAPPGFHVDRRMLESSPALAVSIDSLIRSEARRERWIARVFDRDELLVDGPSSDAMRRRFRHGFHAVRSPDYIICPKSGQLLMSGSRGTDHGSPYDYDSHVPAMIMGPRVRSGSVPGFVATVDLAPTISALLGLGELPDADGEPVTALLR